MMAMALGLCLLRRQGFRKGIFLGEGWGAADPAVDRGWRSEDLASPPATQLQPFGLEGAEGQLKLPTTGVRTGGEDKLLNRK